MWASFPANKRTSSRQSAGFTLIELIVVIAVIGILVAISVIAYNGVTAKANAAALQSDLSNAWDQLGSTAAYAHNHQYPQASTAALKATAGDTLTYNLSTDSLSYCLQATRGSMNYFVTNTSKNPQTGTCNGTLGVPSS